MSENSDPMIEKAAAAIASAEALLITAGAGMGVDSGLPDFRGNKGFWKAYPPLEKLGISFVEMANPDWFTRDPELAWGFYGHRLHLYRETCPHAGFDLLGRWARTMPGGAFAFTSNVDGHFQAAGFDSGSVLECHGSIHHLQCIHGCTRDIWPADDITVDIDPETFRASAPLPVCPECGDVARPNILMFGDWGWLPSRTSLQGEAFDNWLQTVRDFKLVIVELGAGTAVPTVRMTSEQVAARVGGTLIRINPREPQCPNGHCGIAGPGLSTLNEINTVLKHDGHA